MNLRAGLSADLGGTRRPVACPRRGRLRSTLAARRLAGHTGGMAVSLHHVVIDAHDLPAMARFWAQVLGWRILSEREREVVIGADATAPVGICFMPVTDVKTIKNRLHLDLSPDPGEQEAEIERILALGARRVDIGQTGVESWTVLADPEGNEFCVVRPKRTLIG
jgi:predicted enzyme related to lactoylglutathione lyase